MPSVTVYLTEDEYMNFVQIPKDKRNDIAAEAIKKAAEEWVKKG
jgi:hypothetical protein